MKTKPKSKSAAKATAKAKTKSAPKKVSKPVAKAASSKAKTLAKSAPKTVAKTSKPAAKPVAKTPIKPAAKPAAPVKPTVAAKPAAPAKPAPVAARPSVPAPAPAPVQAGRPMMTGPVVATPAPKKLSFKAGELVVYPAHGVGKIVMIEEQEIAGAKLELYIVDFEKEKLRLKVPTGRAEQKGMRRLSDKGQIEVALKVLKGRARIKRTMWSRRAQEYDAKINSGDLIAVSEVVRDLYRSERQPEQSYSERQLFEQALERMAREIAAVKKIDDDQAIKELEEYLAKNARRPAGTEKAEDDVQADEAA
ncbi:MAG: CarD family transcriptional regulator [Aestuariivirga sp.]|jgi:CarD family transcriptional regulator